MNFQVNKTKKSVKLFLSDRSPMTGSFFLSDNCEWHHGAERITDIMMGNDHFLPFESDDGLLWIIQKNQIVKVVVDKEFELEIIRSYGIEEIHGKGVIVSLTGGIEEQGLLLVEPREGASRVMDEINRGKGFISVISGESIHIIGLPFVVMLRELT
jgi:hypothetical protein